MRFAVRLEEGPDIYLAAWDGDPGRTYVIESAKTFATVAAAKRALTRARNTSRRLLPNAVVIGVSIVPLSEPVE